MIINSVACVQKYSKKVSENRHMGVKGIGTFSTENISAKLMLENHLKLQLKNYSEGITVHNVYTVLSVQDTFLFFFFLGLGFYFIFTVLQCDLPPLRPHCWEAPGRDSKPERAIQRKGNYIGTVSLVYRFRGRARSGPLLSGVYSPAEDSSQRRTAIR